jgi:hypothetical protein
VSYFCFCVLKIRNTIINLNQQHLSLNISALFPVENKTSVNVIVANYGLFCMGSLCVSETNIILFFLSLSERNFYWYVTWCHVGLSSFSLLHEEWALATELNYNWYTLHYFQQLNSTNKGKPSRVRYKEKQTMSTNKMRLERCAQGNWKREYKEIGKVWNMERNEYNEMRKYKVLRGKKVSRGILRNQ